MKGNKLKQISAILALMAMTSNSLGATAEALAVRSNITINTEEGADYSAYLYSVFNSLPDYLLSYLDYKKSNIVFLESEQGVENVYAALTKQKPSSSALGYCDFKNKTVYVEAVVHKGYYQKYSNSSLGLTEDEFNKKIVCNKLIHELGHLIDYYWELYLSRSAEFQNIYQEELNSFYQTTSFRVDNFSIKANTKDSSEYFASAFACYFTYPDELKGLCPKTFQYIDNYLKELEKVFSNNEVKSK